MGAKVKVCSLEFEGERSGTGEGVVIYRQPVSGSNFSSGPPPTDLMGSRSHCKYCTVLVGCGKKEFYKVQYFHKCASYRHC